VSLGDLEELVMAKRCRIDDAGLDSRIRTPGPAEHRLDGLGTAFAQQKHTAHRRNRGVTPTPDTQKGRRVTARHPLAERELPPRANPPQQTDQLRTSGRGCHAERHRGASPARWSRGVGDQAGLALMRPGDRTRLSHRAVATAMRRFPQPSPARRRARSLRCREPYPIRRVLLSATAPAAWSERIKRRPSGRPLPGRFFLSPSRVGAREAMPAENRSRCQPRSGCDYRRRLSPNTSSEASVLLVRYEANAIEAA
jgi:hypothetical protein